MDSTKPLMENNNNDMLNVTDYGFETPCKGRTSRELQSVCSDEAADYSCCSPEHTEPNSVQRNNDQYTQRSVALSFPDPPADLDQHLDQHMRIIDEILKNYPSTSRDDSYYCQIRIHLDALLQNISTTKSCSVLMNWVSQRNEVLENPELDLVDVWETEAQDKLLERAKEEISNSLEKILQADRRQTVHNEETYIQLNVDIIQCIEAMPKLVHYRSSILSNRVKEVCFQELQSFVNSYTSEQAEILSEKAQTWREKGEKPEMIDFLKTLKTCKELRLHVQTKGHASNLVKETKKTLEKLETQTLELLKNIVSELAESCLKDYFKYTNSPWNCLSLHKPCKRHCDLCGVLKRHFPNLPYALDEQTIVMDVVYKAVAHSYVKHLIQKPLRTLTKHWSPDVGEAVNKDALELHSTISDLAPDIQQQNHLLLMIIEVINCKNLDTLKLIIGSKQKDLVEQSEDLTFLPKLLQWKGLSKSQVREVLEALPDSPITSSGSFISRFCCCN